MKNSIEVSIRKAQKADNQALAILIRKAFGEHNAPTAGTVYSDPTTDNLYELFKKQKSALWVAEENGKILGCCGVYPTEGLPAHCVELVKFYLLAKARGKGTGTRLMQRCIQYARKSGYTQLYLESLPQFANAVRMYKKSGFEKLEKPLGDSGHSSCNIWMIKYL